MIGSIHFPLTGVGIAAALMLLSAPSAKSQGDNEETFDRTPRKCISTPRIRNTDILDDRTILFYLRGNKEVYRTYLPRECPGLERNDRFAYRTVNSQLCSLDTITVLEQFGTQLNPSFTCRLGEFIPITREEAEDLKLDQDNASGKRKAITSAPAQVPPEGGEAAAPGADAATPEAESASPPPAQAEAAPKQQRRGSGVTVR